LTGQGLAVQPHGAAVRADDEDGDRRPRSRKILPRAAPAPRRRHRRDRRSSAVDLDVDLLEPAVTQSRLRERGHPALHRLPVDLDAGASPATTTRPTELCGGAGRELACVDGLQVRLVRARLDPRRTTELVEQLGELQGREVDHLEVRCFGWPSRPSDERLREAVIVASGVRRSCAASETSRGKACVVFTTERSDTNLRGWQSRGTLLDDLQASPPEGATWAVACRSPGRGQGDPPALGRREKLISAEIDCTVDLDPAQKGVHMSRFPELFEEAIDEVVIGEAFLVEELAEHIARHIVGRQARGRAEVRIVRATRSSGGHP
jgi:hypothetical protein